MTGLDGKLLAKAREHLAAIKEDNRREAQRRRAEIYAKAPEVREADARLRAIMVELFGAAMGSGGDVAALERESLDIQAKRAETLTALGYSADYLDEIVCCEKCRDSGYVMGPCAPASKSSTSARWRRASRASCLWATRASSASTSRSMTPR